MIETETETTVATDGGKFAERRYRFARLSRDPEHAVKQMAARIVFLIQFYSEDGESLRVRQIKRGLHSSRYLEFNDALRLLEKRKLIVIRRVPSRSRPVLVVTLKQNRSVRLPDPYTFHRKKKRKSKKRPPSDWFLEHRQFFDIGIHTGFAVVQPWSESAFWLEQERMQEETMREDQVKIETE
jgi:hypothetical protein